MRPTRLRVCPQHDFGRIATPGRPEYAATVADQAGGTIDEPNSQVLELGYAHQSGRVHVLEHSAQAVCEKPPEYHQRVSVHNDRAEQEAQVERGLFLSQMVVLIPEYV